MTALLETKDAAQTHKDGIAQWNLMDAMIKNMQAAALVMNAKTESV